MLGKQPKHSAIISPSVASYAASSLCSQVVSKDSSVQVALKLLVVVVAVAVAAVLELLAVQLAPVSVAVELVAVVVGQVALAVPATDLQGEAAGGEDDQTLRPRTSETICESEIGTVELGRLVAGYLRPDHAISRRLLRDNSG
jgi:hypothetical protein